jgi:hypothetical protein
LELPDANPVLTAIKLLHTVIWAFLAGSIVALPAAGDLAMLVIEVVVGLLGGS